MDMSSAGVTRYFRNYMTHQVLQETQRATGQPMMVSAARNVQRALAERVQRMVADNVAVDRESFAAALNTTMHEHVADYPGYFDQGTDNQMYNDIRNGYTSLMQQNNMLPISPYDTLWRGRSTVRDAGHDLLYIRGDDIDRLANGDISRIHEFRGEALQLMGTDGQGGLEDKGPALSLDDKSGLTELSSRMTAEEYQDVRRHVLSAGEDNFMSAEAVQRAAAVLDDLRADGVSYDISADRNPGQIKARLAGTKLEIRLMDIKRNEQYAAARVYDDGVATRYTTSLRDDRTNSSVPYTPTPAQAVDLVRFAQGKPMRRWDDPSMVVGESGQHVRGDGIRPNTYMPRGKASATFVVGELPGRSGHTVMIMRDATAKTLPQSYLGEQQGVSAADRAMSDLDEYVGSARENFRTSLDVERLVAEYQEYYGEDAEALEEPHYPEFSGDDEIAAIQRTYWDVLTGQQDTLLRPGVDAEDFQAAVDRIDEMGLDADAARYLYREQMADFAYVTAGAGPDDPAALIREHADDTVDELIGRLELQDAPGQNGQRFNPSRVAQHMTSEKGYWGNREDIIAAVRAAQIDPAEFAGDGFHVESLKDQLVQFDAESAMAREQVTDPFVGSMMDTVSDTLTRSGATPQAIQIDAQGVIQYTAVRHIGVRSDTPEVFTGEIGQVFPRGEYGVVVTNFAASDDYMMVPGYVARIAAQQPGENLSVEERTRLRGFEQVMQERIEHQVSTDALNFRSEVGSPASLNGVYRGLYDTRHEPDFIQRAQEQGMDPEYIASILATESRRVKYENQYAQDSTLFAEWRANSAMNPQDMTNDSFDDPWVRTGGRNMAIMTEVSDGYFDPVMTNGATGQGTVRFLVESAEVNADGTIVQGELDDAVPLRKLDIMQSTSFDPYDRQQMTASNLMNASSVAPQAKTVMMTFGGWTFDDPVVVSKDFAEANGVRDADGNIRALVPGDKVSDFHGNKGVISLVVDPDMDITEAEEQGLLEPVSVFQENPDLDVVMSPFSAASRFNGGTARELMENPVDMRLPSLETAAGVEHVSGGIGEMNLIITHKDVDSGTRVYGDDDLAAGRGRKASAQLAWALGSHQADAVMAEFYGPNNAAAANFREMAITMGLDMRADGTLTEGRWGDTERHVFEMPDLVRREPTARQPIGTLDQAAMSQEFASMIDARGGEMELPFPLKMPTGQDTPEGAKEGTWMLPVLSAHLRSGQDMDDGISVAHDHTRQYLQIFRASCLYRDATERMETGAYGSKGQDGVQVDINKACRQAQGAYDSITADLEARRFSGKNNVFKEGLMSARQPDSATAVWTADPRLELQQLGMGTAMAESLELKDGDHVMIWRDPVLRDAGVRYMEVKTDERLTGVAINPAMDKSFDGDFDGDSVGIVKLQSNAAKQEAMQKLSIQANLLDEGQVDEDGFHPLNIQDSLDIKVAQFKNPELAQRYQDLTVAANDVHADWKEGTLTDEQRLAQNTEILGELSSYYQEAFASEYGNAALRFDSPESHLKSVVEACVDTGAKGSESKVANYAQYFGAEVDFALEHVDQPSLSSERLSVGQVYDHTLHTREQEQGSMRAVAVKSFGTGVAGAFSQRGVKALRNEELKAVLELTYPVTQSVLQSKHDPAEADMKYQAMMGPARALWRGSRLEKTADGTWEAARDKNGDEITCDVEEWKGQFTKFYEDSHGLNIKGLNPEHISRVATALADPETGKMLSIEEPEVLSDYGKETALMDRLAYGGNFEMLHEAAKAKDNIFNGKQNGHFAPHHVQKAQALQADIDVAQRLDLPQTLDELHQQQAQSPVLAVPDTLQADHAASAARGGKRRSDRAVGIRGPRTVQTERVVSQPVVPEPVPTPEPEPVAAASSQQPAAAMPMYGGQATQSMYGSAQPVTGNAPALQPPKPLFGAGGVAMSDDEQPKPSQPESPVQPVQPAPVARPVQQPVAPTPVQQPNNGRAMFGSGAVNHAAPVVQPPTTPTVPQRQPAAPTPAVQPSPEASAQPVQAPMPPRAAQPPMFGTARQKNGRGDNGPGFGG